MLALRFQNRHKAITSTWLPLAGTWLMMAFEGPFLAALIARSDNPKENLAAFGIAYAIGLIMESPIIMLMAAAVRLVKDQQSYQKLFNFHMMLNVSISIIMLLLVSPLAFNYLANQLLLLSSTIADLTKTSLFLLLPWPAAIGYRRFYQGILINHGQAKLVAKATTFRLASLVILGFTLWKSNLSPGAYIGAATLSFAVITEAIAVRMMAQRAVTDLCNDHLGNNQKSKAHKRKSHGPLTYRFIFRFYYPLALTAMLGLMSGPLVTFAMNRASMPLESLAVLPIVNGFTFIFRAIPLSFQEVIISFLSRSESYYRSLKQYIIWLAVVLTLIFITIATTPLSDLWLISLSGLSRELANFARPAIICMLATPALSLLLCWQRAICIHRQKTQSIKTTSFIEIAAIAAILYFGIAILDLVGVIAAACSLMIARALAVTYLGLRVKALRKSSQLVA